jgi:GT2 family glycosyltransferase
MHGISRSVESHRDTPMISVVIPTLNREEPLCNTLRYFLEVETYPEFEVIVIDQSDNHAEATRNFLAEHAAQIRYVVPNYKGLPKARNHGVQIAKGEIVVFVDDDVEPAPGFLLAHARCYVDEGIVGVAGPTPLPGQFLKTREEIGDLVYQSLVQQRQMRFDVDFPFSAQWAQGCNMSFRRAQIIALGGFDEVFQRAPIGDDAEFSHRARKRGTIRYVPDARLVHMHVPSGGCRDAASQREYQRNVAFCVNYFWFRIEAPVGQRMRAVWRAFRANVLNRNMLSSKGNVLHAAIGFTEGVWKSSTYIRRLDRSK